MPSKRYLEAEGLYEIALHERQMGHADEAMRSCEEAIKLFAKHVPSIQLLSELSFEKGQRSKGIFLQHLAEKYHDDRVPEDEVFEESAPPRTKVAPSKLNEKIDRSRDLDRTFSPTRLVHRNIAVPQSKHVVGRPAPHRSMTNDQDGNAVPIPMPEYRLEDLKAQLDGTSSFLLNLPKEFLLTIDGSPPAKHCQLVDEALKLLLKRTWEPFYGGFQELREVQKQTISPILAKKDVLISASTSSGKTEAVMAPLVERLLNENWNKLSIIYITPAKALANNISDRLEFVLKKMGLKSGLHTGDNHDVDFGRLPNVMITTPEAIDSLMRRQPSIFLTVRAFVIDEIHLLDGNYRGDQLIVLLKRIRKLSGLNPTVIGLSATVSRPEEMFARYSIKSDREVVVVGGRKGHRCHFVPDLKASVDLIGKLELKKGIFFCNARRSVERRTEQLKKMLGQDKVMAHHGSLSRESREDTEVKMIAVSNAFVVATTTLEIGIDIGDLDVVIIAESPWSVSSLAQRIGRACRKIDTVNVIFVNSSTEEVYATLKMLDCIVRSRYECEDYEFDPSVLVQQLISMALFRDKIGTIEQDFRDVLGGLCKGDDLASIMAHLVKIDVLQVKDGMFFPVHAKLPDNIHSNVPDSPMVKVVNVENDKEIGQVMYPVDDHFLLEGKCWRVTARESTRVLVAHSGMEGFEAKFSKHETHGAFFEMLPDHIRSRYEVFDDKIVE